MRQRLLSLLDHRQIRYSVRWVLDRHTIAHLKVKHQRITTNFHLEQPKGRTVVVHEYFQALLTAKKPIRNQLILEYPTLNGLRTEEVCTIRRRDLDFERGILHVLDSKKHAYMPIPLDPTNAQHSWTLIQELGLEMDDYLIQRRIKGGAQPENPDSPITKQAIINTWWRLCDLVGVPRMSPRVGRAYFAAKWHFVEHKSLYGLMVCMRHSSLRVSQRYIERIVSFEDVWNEFMIGREVPFQKGVEKHEAKI